MHLKQVKMEFMKLYFHLMVNISQIQILMLLIYINSIIMKDKNQRDLFLNKTNSVGVMTRPIWTLMNSLQMFQRYQCGDLSNSNWLEQRVVNIPSGALIK